MSYRYGLGTSRLHSARYAQALLDSALQALALATNAASETVAQGAVLSAIIGGKAGSTYSLVSSVGSRFAISGGNLVRGSTALNYSTATDFGNGLKGYSITVRETNAGFDPSTRETTLTFYVTTVAVAATIFNTTGNASLTGNQVSGFATEAGELDAEITTILSRLSVLEAA